jgi:hypothetical protein
MLTPLLIGCLVALFTMGIQVGAVVLMLRYLLRLVSRQSGKDRGFGFDTYVISMVLLVLFIGHLIQVGIWAALFLHLGEFSDFHTAFYHSLVNFASLGYGDIVMSEQWRMLGALESSIGVLMFGLTAGIMIAVMTPLFARHSPSKEQVRRMHDTRDDS